MNNNPLRTLRLYRDFRRLWLSAAVSDIGSWMQAVTVTVLVATTSKSAASTAMVYSALFFPQAVCAPLGGLLADRFDRRHVAITVQVVQAFIAGGLAFAVASGVESPIVLALLVALLGCANAIGQPAYTAMIPLLVPRSDLYPAMSLGAVSWNAGRILGPVLAAVTVRAWGAPATIGINAVSFLVMAGMLLTIRRPLKGGGHVELREFRSEVATAARLIWHTPTLRLMLVTVAVMQTTLAGGYSLVPLYSDTVGGGDRLPQVLFAAIGLGALIGALTVSALARQFGRANVLTAALFGAATMLVVVSQVHGSLPATLAMFLFGVTATPAFVLIGGVVQREAPEHYRGRITSLQVAAIGFVFGVMAPLGGFLADNVWGLRTQFAISGTVLAVAVLAAALLRPQFAGLVNGSDPMPRRQERREERREARVTA